MKKRGKLAVLSAAHGLLSLVPRAGGHIAAFTAQLSAELRQRDR
jgi:hypothetical protein